MPLPGVSSAWSVAWLIIPRSATTQKEPASKRLCRLLIAGKNSFTSVALPGKISQATGRPCSSSAAPTIICFRSGRLSLECPRCPSLSPPSPSK